MPAEPATTVIRVLHEARFATLATLEADGAPYASLVAVALDDTGAPLLLLSDLARHTRNLKREGRISLLFTDEAKADPLNAPRASLLGQVFPASDDMARTRYLERHSGASGYAGFADFGFYRVAVAEVHLVEGFGRISTIAGNAVAIDWSGAERVRAAQDGVVSHMNADHADAVALYATKLLGAAEGGWRVLSVDPLGCDLASESQVKRLEFPQRVTSLAAMREVFVALAHQARA